MSVRKRKWLTDGEGREAWVADYVDAAGKRRRKAFQRKKDADAFLVKAKSEVREGVHVPDSESSTVAAAGRNWLKAVTNAGRERSTIDQYRQHVELHIAPLLGEVRLNQLTVAGVADFERRLREAGRSTALVRKVMVSLSSLLEQAREDQLVARNVARERGRRRGDRAAEKRAKAKLRVGEDIPLPSEIKAIVAHLSGRWRPMLLTAIFTGLRASELRGLRWVDIDFDAKVVHVRQRADRFNAIGRPKSEAGERAVPLTPLVLNTLREWRLVCPKRDTGRRDDAGKPIRELDLVFPNGAGRVESLGNIINRGLLPVQIRAGVTVDTGKVGEDGEPIVAAKYTGMHALRHFYASWCINRKADGGLELPPKVVQERLGHATITLTLDTYSHLFPRSDYADELAAAEMALLR